MAINPCKSSLITSQSRMLDGLVFQRRSVRKYKRDPLPEAWLEAMLQCALQAPSPSNSQPVRFVRVASNTRAEALRLSLDKGRDRLISKHKAINGSARLRNLINAYYRYSCFMFDAPVLFAVGVSTEIMGFSDKLAAAGLMEESVDTRPDLDISVGLALKGLLLKAQSLGVGSCVLTAPLVFMEDVESLLNIESIIVKCFVTLGLADETPKATERLPMQSVVQVV